MTDQFLIEGPAVISFSGGRTSGYMLWRILQAHQWILPDDVRVLFANTGKEMPETLDFVRDCGLHWNVPITWVEYRRRIGESKQHAIVTYETASRNGEPFDAVIADYGPNLPNVRSRYCSHEMKTRLCNRVAASFGWEEWDSIIGFRADEPERVAKMRGDIKSATLRAPLAVAGITKYVVAWFWKSQIFDLALPNINGTTPLGNCDCCFLKGRRLPSIIAEKPDRAIWWMNHETSAEKVTGGNGNRFRLNRPSYTRMYEVALAQESLVYDDDALQDCACTD